MINKLKEELKIAEEQLKQVAAPYQARVKDLRTAIKALEDYDRKAVEINRRKVATAESTPVNER